MRNAANLSPRGIPKQPASRPRAADVRDSPGTADQEEERVRSRRAVNKRVSDAIDVGRRAEPRAPRVSAAALYRSVGWWAANAGNQTVNVLETPSVLSTVIVPPWSSTRRFTIAKPSPLPPNFRDIPESAC